MCFLTASISSSQFVMSCLKDAKCNGIFEEWGMEKDHMMGLGMLEAKF
jgi:hypothetical protein